MKTQSAKNCDKIISLIDNGNNYTMLAYIIKMSIENTGLM